MLILHNGFDESQKPTEFTTTPAETTPPASAPSNPPNTEAEKKEDQFEKALADPEAPTPFHLNVYARTFLGALLLLSLIAFYVTHISGHHSFETYGQTPYQPGVNHLTNH